MTITYRVLSVHPHHAALFALGVRSVETRSKSTRLVGEPFAFHATKTIPGLRRGDTLVIGDFTVERDDPRGCEPAYLLRGPKMSWPYRLPTGAITSTATLADVVPTREVVWGTTPGWRTEVLRSGADHVEEIYVGRDQQPYGDFAPGRFAWLFSGPRSPMRPVPFKGGQGLTKTWTP